MHYYAQLDENGICAGLSQLSGECGAANMVTVSEADYTKGNLIGKLYIGGKWEKPEEAADE